MIPDSVIARSVAAVKKYGSLRKAGVAIGVDRATIARHLDRVKFKPEQKPKVDPIEAERTRAAQAAERKEHITAVKELAFRKFLSKLVANEVQPLPATPITQLPKKSKTAHHRFPLLCLTDWHFEERVESAGVHGLNSFDIETACRRVWRVVQACRAWKRDFEASGRFRIPELTVALMGDFLTGTLHGLERHSDAPNVVRAALWCADLLTLALRDLATEFGKLNIVGVVGNHGRLPDDKKVPTKDPTRSWDYLVYEIARRRLENTPGLNWNLPEAYGVLFEVGGHWCYSAHGNFIPNSFGVVGYGMRRFNSALSGNLQAAGKPIKYSFFGHWHASNSSEFAGMESFICPSLIGTQEYGFLKGGSVSKSAQQLFIFDRDLGLCSQERIYGEGGDGDSYRGAYKVAA